jgi:hypothetical protein
MQRDRPKGCRAVARAGEDAVGGRHESPKPGTDVFMAVVVLVLLALPATVVVPAVLGE